jgi:hypothetical protein
MLHVSFHDQEGAMLCTTTFDAEHLMSMLAAHKKIVRSKARD